MIKPNVLPRYQRKAKQWLRLSGGRGLEIYKGPSTMPGQLGKPAPVLALLTMKSENVKLGGQFQTWHIRADMHPLHARREGAHDGCICGDGDNGCPFRAKPGQLVGACYPSGLALSSLWRSYGRGNYPNATELAKFLRLSLADTLAVVGSLGGGVRLGAYGDPVAMPAPLAQALTSKASTRQGFTHQWRAAPVNPWARLVMASCELPEQVGKAAAAGWRTYTAYPPELTEAEARRAIHNASGRNIVAHCPASARKGYRVTCETCPIQCDGVKLGAPWHVVNAVHGADSVLARYKGLGYLARWRAYL